VSQERNPVSKNPQYILVFCTSGSHRDPWGTLHRGVYGGLMCTTVLIKGHALVISDVATIVIHFHKQKYIKRLIEAIKQDV